MKRSTALKISFIITFFYVGLGTVCLLSMYPKDLLNGDWVIGGLLFTLPINFISFGIMFMDKNMVTWVYLIQFCVLLFTWVSIYKLFFKSRVK